MKIPPTLAYWIALLLGFITVSPTVALDEVTVALLSNEGMKNSSRTL